MDRLKKHMKSDSCSCSECGKPGFEVSKKRVPIKYTKSFIDKLVKAKVDHEDKNAMFLHCQHCLQIYLNSDHLRATMSAAEYGQYEMSSVRVEVDGIGIGIWVLWCKRCGRQVWDSRHLRHAF